MATSPTRATRALEQYTAMNSEFMPFKQLEDLRRLVMEGKLREDVYNEIHRIQIDKFARARKSKKKTASTSLRAAASSPAIMAKKSFKIIASSPKLSKKKRANVDTTHRTPDGDVYTEKVYHSGEVWVCALGRAAAVGKRARVTWRKRFVTLYASRIEFDKRRTPSVLTWLSADHYVDADKYLANPSGDDANVFLVSNYESTFAFATETAEEKETWMRSVLRTIKSLVDFSNAGEDEPTFLDRPARSASVVDRQFKQRLASYRASSVSDVEEGDEDAAAAVSADKGASRDNPEVAPEPVAAAAEPPRLVEMAIPQDDDEAAVAASSAASSRRSSRRESSSVVAAAPAALTIDTSTAEALDADAKLPPVSPINDRSTSTPKLDPREEERDLLRREKTAMDAMVAKAQTDLESAAEAVDRLKTEVATYSAAEEELTVLEEAAVETAEEARDYADGLAVRASRAKTTLSGLESEWREAKALIEAIDEEEDETATVVSVSELDDALLAVGSSFEKARRHSRQENQAALSSRLQALLAKDGVKVDQKPKADRRRSLQEVPLPEGAPAPAETSSRKLEKQTSSSSSSRPLSLLGTSGRRLSLLRRSSSASQRRSETAARRAQLVALAEEKEGAVRTAKSAHKETEDLAKAAKDIADRREKEAVDAEQARVDAGAKAFAAQKRTVQTQAKFAKARHKHAQVMEHYNRLRVRLAELDAALGDGPTQPPATPTLEARGLDEDDDDEDAGVEMDVEARDPLDPDGDGLRRDDSNHSLGSGIVLSEFGERLRRQSRKKRADSKALGLGRKRVDSPFVLPVYSKPRSASEVERARFEDDLIT